MEFDLRPARADDWPLAWEIQRSAFLDLVTRTWGGWTPEQVQKCADAWDPAATRMIVAGGRVVGWVRTSHPVDHDWLDLVVIAPDAQRSGLGTAVMRRLIGDAGSRGVPLRLSVYRENRARALYRRLGFLEQARDELRVLMVHPADGGPMDADTLFWELADALRAEDPRVVEGTIMNGRCLRVGAEFLALVDHKGSGLVVKLDRARVDALIAEGVGRPFAPAGRTFREWVAVPVPDRARWAALLREGVALAAAR